MAIGLVVIVLNGASYKDNFSTILRVSRTAALSKEVKESEGDGTEPLPPHLANSRVVIGVASKQDSVSSSENHQARQEEEQAISQESNLLPKANVSRTETP